MPMLLRQLEHFISAHFFSCQVCTCTQAPTFLSLHLLKQCTDGHFRSFLAIVEELMGSLTFDSRMHMVAVGC